MNISGQYILLRALEPSDIDTLYEWENNYENWFVSNTSTPFSRYILEQYIISSHQDIYTAKQLRLMIVLKQGLKPIGTIDLFDFDPSHQRAGVGILIGQAEERGKGYASEALELIIDYSFNLLKLHQLYCNVTEDNQVSLKMFQQYGFEICGCKKQWLCEGEKWKDEYTLQLIKNKESK